MDSMLVAVIVTIRFDATDKNRNCCTGIPRRVAFVVVVDVGVRGRTNFGPLDVAEGSLSEHQPQSPERISPAAAK
jgi:hypothetical protein